MAFSMMSCATQMDDLMTDNVKSEEVVYSDSYVSLEEALKNMDPIFSTLENGTRTSTRSVKSVEVYNRVKTRSGEDSPYYIVNYENNEGFAILSSDSRLTPVVAFSDTGSFELSDTLENKAIGFFLNSLPLPPKSDTNATIKPGITFDPTDPGNPFQSPVHKKVISPRLDYTVRNSWHQESPFNSLITNNYDVGCSALACAMVMSYHKWPDFYKGYQYHWDNMIDNIFDIDLATLLKNLGESKNLNIKYTEKSSKCEKGTYARTFKNFGYKEPSKSSMSSAQIYSAVSGCPLLVRGYTINEDNEEASHAWVIDGLYTITHPGSNLAVDPPVDKYVEYFYHCVWGWMGIGNGYFLLDYMNSDYHLGGTADYLEEDDLQFKTTKYDFYNMEFYYNFVPDK